MKHFTSDDINRVLSQLTCRHPACLQVLSRKNTSGFCSAHYRTRNSGEQTPRKGTAGLQFVVPEEVYTELAWLAANDRCTLAEKCREMLEWGLRTLDEDERMPR